LYKFFSSSKKSSGHNTNGYPFLHYEKSFFSYLKYLGDWEVRIY
jgi:hypothetical protein